MTETWTLEELHRYQTTGEEPGTRCTVSPPRSLMLTLPYPPSANHFYSVARQRKVLSVQGQTYQAVADKACLTQLVGVARPLTGRFALTVEVFPPDHRLRDADGPLKHTQDTLQRAGVLVNDSQIDEIHVYRRGVVAGGKIVLALTTLASPQEEHSP